ncbi:Peptidyl-prolyl cis-trans isomerase [Fasciolopsis buskii]|uniref:Peptidyl-prolyl cis-trans isomerase n=1 Tax=Fasciolopsis buskii TaxID=27845 RepID=A0A8E0S3I7_9TREM|nr:Peptidyl-prolyl cis-trans isomerase [Fasciolopsis buski]
MRLKTIEIFGLLRREAFQKAKFCAKDLYEAHPEKFREPKVQAMLEFDWNNFITNKRKELGGSFWTYSMPVLCFIDGEVIGSDDCLRKWAEREYNCRDYRPMALYSVIANDAYVNRMLEANRIFISMLITIGGQRCGALLIELYSDLLPKTCENFRALCTGEKGKKPKNSVESYTMHYKNTLFFRCVKNGWIQGGDVLYNRGNDGCSIYGRTFEDESFAVKHDQRGIVSMANAGRHTNGSQFFITLAPTPWMDNLYVAFGRVVEGSETLGKMENVPTVNDRPVEDVCIAEVRVMDPLRLETKIV